MIYDGRIGTIDKAIVAQRRNQWGKSLKYSLNRQGNRS